ncbi:hypothetical protein BON22_1369 [Cyberlindnera fabianii]|uniref:Secreted glycosidase n=1 Tax=Cyberlindnera fabianii TaxID=36022 RepID=A0A1V2LBT2_CYBFA|nr:hypothetical protein BON22_1369 [Cyberlindnera fabianii]
MQDVFFRASSPSVTEVVDLFFGTENGNVFPGPSRPFGFAKMGVDVVDGSFVTPYSGYSPGGRVSGISMMHESGTGGAPEYGVVSQLPLVGEVDLSMELSVPRAPNLDDTAEVGKYITHLSNGVNVTFASGDRSGFYDYSFPGDNTASSIVINVAHHLTAPTRPQWSQHFLNGSIEVSDDRKSYSGYSTINNGWGEQGPWTIYFYGEFDKEADSVTTFVGTSVTAGEKTSATTVEDQDAGVVFHFGNNISVKSRAGISFLGVIEAKANLEKDSSKHDFSVESVANETQNLWESEVFDAVTVSQENSTLVSLLYTALYGASLLPSNRTGESPSWTSSEPYYDDWFTIWDIFRSSIPMYNIINRGRSAEIVRSLIEIYRHDGYMPDGRSANQNGRTQGGTNADIVLADAYVKGIKNGIDWESGLNAMIKDAEVEPEYRYDPFAPDASTFEGRGGLSDWKAKGYISTNYTRSLSRTMEYAYNDYAVYAVSKGLGNKGTDVEKYLKRSAQWQNIWNFDTTLSGANYKGFIHPRDPNGQWITDYSPDSCGGCYWGDIAYEGKPLEYGWTVPHDIETLKNFIGDDQTFSARLDDMFSLYGRGFADIGNEPSFLTPYLYNFVNNATRTAETIRFLMNTNFSTGINGLPGNSDAGAMQSWMFWAMMGLYPITGTSTYLLSAPMFENVKLRVDHNVYVYIIGENLSRSPDYKYVQSVEVNGEQWNKNWVTHDELFANGGRLKFVMGTEPNMWDSEGDVPPSPGHLNIKE